MRLESGNGLFAEHEGGGAFRIAWGEADWLGPGTVRVDSPGRAAGSTSPRVEVRESHGDDAWGEFRSLAWAVEPGALEAGLTAYRDAAHIVLELSATADLPRFANGHFAQPSFAWHFAPLLRKSGGVPEGTRSYGHQFTEFALPVSGTSEATGFFFAPHRPPIVEPFFLIAPDGRTLMLAPLDHFHDQVIAVPADTGRAEDGVSCGWHGDLDAIPRGFRTRLGVFAAPGPRAALETWAAILRREHRTERLSRYADELLAGLSYWTDNGAVYYYRAEPGHDCAGTLERVVKHLDEQEVPVRSVQIDSWFYPHELLRPVSEEGAPIVPPTGMLRWEPREDVFPEGLHSLRKRLGNRPLTFHSRHFSAKSPYFKHFDAWHDGDYAQPRGPELYEMLMANAASWGAITYEQDWLVESFLGVRGLRQVPGRARAWQETMDNAAGNHGLHLQWCMGTPADFFQTVSLRNIASIRTSGDYRYMFDNGANWVWFLHTNALARALGLWPFKDVFLTHGPTTLSEGEPYAEIEALLSALSAGPVGIGDQIGHTDRNLALRCCIEDGTLVKPDVPLAAIDASFRANGFLEPLLLKGETFSQHPAGRWIYATTFNACGQKLRLEEEVRPRDFAGRDDASYVAYDWRRSTREVLAPGRGWRVQLDFQDWDFRLLCPLLEGDVTVFGDVEKYASVGDRRVSGIECDGKLLRLWAHGIPGTRVTITGFAAHRPHTARTWQAGGGGPLPESERAGEQGWSWNESDGIWHVTVEFGAQSYAMLELEMGRA